MPPTVEAVVCLWDQVIDDNGNGIGRVRRSRRLSNNGGGVDRGQVIYNASEGSYTTTEAAIDRRQAQVIYDDNGGVGRVR